MMESVYVDAGGVVAVGVAAAAADGDGGGGVGGVGGADVDVVGVDEGVVDGGSFVDRF
jgi:hypothetical protein